MHIKYDMLIDLNEVINLFEGPVYRSDVVLYVLKKIPPLRLFLNRRSVFDKWSLERRKAGNTIFGGPR